MPLEQQQSSKEYSPVAEATHTTAQISTSLIFGINNHFNINLWQSFPYQIAQVLGELIINAERVLAALKKISIMAKTDYDDTRGREW